MTVRMEQLSAVVLTGCNAQLGLIFSAAALCLRTAGIWLESVIHLPNAFCTMYVWCMSRETENVGLWRVLGVKVSCVLHRVWRVVWWVCVHVRAVMCSCEPVNVSVFFVCVSVSVEWSNAACFEHVLRFRRHSSSSLGGIRTTSSSGFRAGSSCAQFSFMIALCRLKSFHEKTKHHLERSHLLLESVLVRQTALPSGPRSLWSSCFALIPLCCAIMSGSGGHFHV